MTQFSSNCRYCKVLAVVGTVVLASIGFGSLRAEDSSKSVRRLFGSSRDPVDGAHTADVECPMTVEASASLPYEEVNGCVELKANSSTLCWKVSEGYVDFHLTLQQWTGQGWFAWGLSESGAMKGADYVVYMQDGNTGELKVEDRFSESFIVPTVDTHGDVRLLSSMLSDGILNSVVRRPLRSCDTQDVEFNLVANTFVWAKGSMSGGEISIHDKADRGSITNVLLNSDKVVPPEIDKEELIMRDFLMPAVEIQKNDEKNHFACAEFILPEEVNDSKAYIVYAEALIDPASAHLVHHIVLTACNDSYGGKGYDSNGLNSDCRQMDSNCQAGISGWAPGASPLMLRKDAMPALGIPAGKGYSKRIMMQMHYYNPNGEVGVIDSSGFRVGFELADESTNRIEIGSIAMGNVGFTLPPGEERAVVHGVCEGEFIKNDMTVLNVPGFGGAFHMHQRGARQVMRLFGPEYDKTYGEPFSQRRYYDYNFQHGSPIQGASLGQEERVIKAGTTIVTTCEFDTSKDDEPITYGDLTQQEMCFTFLSYYPRSSNPGLCATVSGDLPGVPFSGTFNIGAGTGGEGGEPFLNVHWKFWEKIAFNWNTYGLETIDRKSVV